MGYLPPHARCVRDEATISPLRGQGSADGLRRSTGHSSGKQGWVGKGWATRSIGVCVVLFARAGVKDSIQDERRCASWAGVLMAAVARIPRGVAGRPN
jgi:hypothetical protein